MSQGQVHKLETIGRFALGRPVVTHVYILKLNIMIRECSNVASRSLLLRYHHLRCFENVCCITPDRLQIKVQHAHVKIRGQKRLTWAQVEWKAFIEKGIEVSSRQKLFKEL